MFNRIIAVYMLKLIIEYLQFGINLLQRRVIHQHGLLPAVNLIFSLHCKFHDYLVLKTFPDG